MCIKCGTDDYSYPCRSCAPEPPTPKPTTFTLNGEVLPLPDYIVGPDACYVTARGVPVDDKVWGYNSREDADKVRAAFAKLTEGL